MLNGCYFINVFIPINLRFAFLSDPMYLFDKDFFCIDRKSWHWAKKYNFKIILHTLCNNRAIASS